MVDEPTRVIASNVADNAPYTKTRIDERFVSTRQESIVLDSMDQYIVLDEMEVGELQSVRIVVDNPYVQVLLQLDEYRNKDPDGESPAEIIYNGGTDTANRGFKVIDGQGSGKGYVMEYRPDTPEEYKNRVRLVIRNQIQANPAVYGMDLSYTSRGSLANPAVPAHMAGGTFSHPALRSAKLDQISQLMTKPVGVEGYSSNQVFNEAIIFSENPVGSDHPYQGIAGKPTFHKDVSCDFMAEVGTVIDSAVNHNNVLSIGTSTTASLGGYRLVVVDEPDEFPGTSDQPSTMSVEIRPELNIRSGTLAASIAGNAVHGLGNFGFAVTPWYTASTIRKSDLMSAGPFGDTWPGTSTYTPFTGSTDTSTTLSLNGTTLPAAESIIGKRFFFRRGGTVYFPGVVKSVTKSIASSAISTNNNPVGEGMVDKTHGLVRKLDDNHANNLLSSPSDKFPVGAHTSSQNQKFIVIPPFTGMKRSDIIGAKIKEGTADEIELQPQSGGNTTTGGLLYQIPVINNHPDVGYRVLGVPHTPWVYTIEFEPGVTESPIDFNVLMADDDNSPYVAGISNTVNLHTVYLSKGKYQAGQNQSTQITNGVDNSRGLFEVSEQNCWGTVTSQADDNPHILIKEIEVKRTKKVSNDG